MSLKPRDAFVGRDEELSILTRALDEAMEGEWQAVALTGEPGIGKTRLAEELSFMDPSHTEGELWGLAGSA